MSTKKYLDNNGLLYVWGKIKSYITTQLAPYAKTVDIPATYVLPKATSSTLGGVKIGSGFTVDANGVISNNYGGTADSVAWSGVTGKPTTISGYGITDTYTKSEIDTKVSSVFKYKGTKTDASSLPSSGNTTGDVWQVGNEEYAWTGTAWEMLGVAVDLTGYVEEVDLSTITNAEIDTLMA